MQLTVGKVAKLVDGTHQMDGSLVINSLSTLKDAQKDSLSFFINPKYEKALYESNAAAVLVSNNFKPRKALKNVIYVNDPYTSWAQILELFERETAQIKTGIEEPVSIDQTSHIGKDIYIGAFSYLSAGCRVADGVKIYPQVYIGENVSIGTDTVIFPGVKIYGNSVIGNHCTIHAGAVIGSEGFGFAPQNGGSLKRIPQIGNVVLGDHVSIGANTTIDRATVNSTRIEAGVKLDNLVHIGHNVVIGKDSAVAAQAGIAGSATIGENCLFGGQVGVVGHVDVANKTQISPKGGVMSSIQQEGRVLLGAPVMDFTHTKKVWVTWKKLPEMMKRLEELERKL
ncbi:MAG: UDP-3-O-(3-hydroxymyristoyl)glucosamine N-acyltransferase [Cyclobacteriaceae bacterium]